MIVKTKRIKLKLDIGHVVLTNMLIYGAVRLIQDIGRI
jgi:hypothetical protein